MRWLLAPAWALWLTAGLVKAQEAAPGPSALPATSVPAPPFVFFEPDDSLLKPSPLGAESLWKDDRPDWHFKADVGLDVLWTRFSGANSPMLGPNLSLGVVNDRGWGVVGNWMQLEQSKSWGVIRK
jgi:hypothetical protein